MFRVLGNPNTLKAARFWEGSPMDAKKRLRFCAREAPLDVYVVVGFRV